MAAREGLDIVGLDKITLESFAVARRLAKAQPLANDNCP